MIELYAIIFTLIALNAFQFLFWSSQNQELVNKLMSRSYFEYEQVKTPPAPKGFKIEIPSDEAMNAPDELRIMDELKNRLI